MEFEDETPVVEARAFESGIEPMMTSMQTLTPTRSSDDSSETSSHENSEPESSESQQSNKEKGEQTPH